MRKLLLTMAATAAAATATPASAASYIVDAFANSSSGGVGVATFVVAAGQQLNVISNVNDLWSAGALPRYSDGDGLDGNRFATAQDDSGQAPGTLIGIDFGPWTQGNLTTSYGRLVGEINGQFFELGANGTYTAPQAGLLNLFYWDSNNGDNEGQITFAFTGVPEAATWAMMIAGLGAVGAGLRFRRRRLNARIA